MTKKELAEAVADEVGISKKEGAAAVDAVLNTIAKTLKKGQKVSLVGFGTFEVRKRKARTGINPKTKEPIKISASKAPAFKAGKAFKEAVNKK